MSSYDSIPYPSSCFPQSSPAHLHAVARVFGLTPVDLTQAKVLEIGCASGGNLLPLAARFPEAGFTGIDLSENQIAGARERAGRLGLSNVDLIAASITDHDFGDAAFDYIIAHGVYSWVPEDVQTRLLQICGENLSPNGVAFVSYNTLPGWNAVKTIRDMMVYHSRHFDSPEQKILEARNMLAFTAQNMAVQTGPYKETLENEIRILSQASDGYLFHDHLEAVNAPCYFHEFTDRAAKHGLVYLGDSSLSSMFLGNHNNVVADTLSQIDDPVRLEQYLDFMTNRRFRQTLLVKDGRRISREVSAQRLGDLRFIPQYRLKEPVAPDRIGNIDALDLVSVSDDQGTAQVTGRLLCSAVIEMLKALPNRLALAGIAEKTAAVMPEPSVAEVEGALGDVLTQSVFNGLFTLSADKTDICTDISDRPAVFAPALVFGQSMDLVANRHHEVVKLPDDQRLVLPYVTGANTVDEICEHVKEHIAKGELTLHSEGRALDINSDTLGACIRTYVEEMLETFAQNALLAG